MLFTCDGLPVAIWSVLEVCISYVFTHLSICCHSEIWRRIVIVEICKCWLDKPTRFEPNVKWNCYLCDWGWGVLVEFFYASEIQILCKLVIKIVHVHWLGLLSTCKAARVRYDADTRPIARVRCVYRISAVKLTFCWLLPVKDDTFGGMRTKMVWECALESGKKWKSICLGLEQPNSGMSTEIVYMYGAYLYIVEFWLNSIL